MLGAGGAAAGVADDGLERRVFRGFLAPALPPEPEPVVADPGAVSCGLCWVGGGPGALVGV